MWVFNLLRFSVQLKVDFCFFFFLGLTTTSTSSFCWTMKEKFLVISSNVLSECLDKRRINP